MITVYYDGACGLCAKEIAYYRRIAPEGRFVWRDVAREPHHAIEAGVRPVDALRLLHAQDADGRLHIGVAAFLAIWRALPWWRRLAPIVALPGVRHLADAAYRAFAAWRFRRLPHCRLAAEADAAAE